MTTPSKSSGVRTVRIEDQGCAQGNIGRCDHRVTNEYRLFGPPGTGKTSRIADHAKRTGKKHGADKLLVTSFSRTAAAE
jgi:superfamily I DNA/RNA helicase